MMYAFPSDGGERIQEYGRQLNDDAYGEVSEGWGLALTATSASSSGRTTPTRDLQTPRFVPGDSFCLGHPSRST